MSVWVMRSEPPGSGGGCGRHLGAARGREILEQQQRERDDTSFHSMCMFCDQEFTGNRSVLLNHMAREHAFNIGLPDNIVNCSEFLAVLQEKLDNLQCLYCEKIFRDKNTLKDHMRKKQHRRINAKNKEYDRFYIINYLEFGKSWEEVQSEDDRELIDNLEEDWSDWEEHPKSHGFDFLKIKSEHGLNFYQQVKLVNFIRREIHHCRCYNCQEKFQSKGGLISHMEETKHITFLPARSTWDQPQYYFPTYENDTLLCTLSDSEDLVTEDQSEDVPVVSEDISSLKALKQSSVLNQLLREENNMNLVSPGSIHHPVAPLFASPFLFALGPRCSRDRLQQQDAENVLRKAEQPPNCTVKQKQFLSLSGGNGIEVVQQILQLSGNFSCLKFVFRASFPKLSHEDPDQEFVALHKAGTEKPPVKRGPVAGSLCLSVPTSNRKPGHYKDPDQRPSRNPCSSFWHLEEPRKHQGQLSAVTAVHLDTGELQRYFFGINVSKFRARRQLCDAFVSHQRPELSDLHRASQTNRPHFRNQWESSKGSLIKRLSMFLVHWGWKKSEDFSQAHLAGPEERICSIYSPAKAVEASEYVLLRVVCVLAMKGKAKTDFLHQSMGSYPFLSRSRKGLQVYGSLSSPAVFNSFFPLRAALRAQKQVEKRSLGPLTTSVSFEDFPLNAAFLFHGEAEPWEHQQKSILSSSIQSPGLSFRCLRAPHIFNPRATRVTAGSSGFASSQFLRVTICFVAGNFSVQQKSVWKFGGQIVLKRELHIPALRMLPGSGVPRWGQGLADTAGKEW
ncbi:Zinc finger protein 277 [Aix galericulata]|nr:Zinc finger protein 277 [Aix galericulata]